MRQTVCLKNIIKLYEQNNDIVGWVRIDDTVLITR